MHLIVCWYGIPILQVEELRARLEDAQNETAVATRDAVEAEVRAAARADEAVARLTRQQKEMEDAYEMLKV